MLVGCNKIAFYQTDILLLLWSHLKDRLMLKMSFLFILHFK